MKIICMVWLLLPMFYCSTPLLAVTPDKDAVPSPAVQTTVTDNDTPVRISGPDSPIDRAKPRVRERQDERDRMVRDIKSGPGRPGIKDEKVLEAMKYVPRHLFVPSFLGSDAYYDRPLPIGHGQTISQPYIVAFMTELLQVEAGDRVLEIGTGSGYQAAVLSELTPHVFTVEIIKALAERSKGAFRKLGYGTIKVKTGDGYYGWQEKGPFDGIIVTCAAGHIPPPLLAQLKPGGRMVAPVGSPYATQRLVVVTKDADGKLTTRDSLPVVFVPMTGRAEK